MLTTVAQGYNYWLLDTGFSAGVMNLYYAGNMTQGKLLEFLEDIGIRYQQGIDS